MRRWFLFNCSTLVTPQLWLKQQPLTNLMHPNVCFNNTAQNNNRETKPQEDLEQDLPMMENPPRQQSSQNMENKINKINNYSLAFWNRYTSRRRGKNCYCVTPLVKKNRTPAFIFQQRQAATVVRKTELTGCREKKTA